MIFYTLAVYVIPFLSGIKSEKNDSIQLPRRSAGFLYNSERYDTESEADIENNDSLLLGEVPYFSPNLNMHTPEIQKGEITLMCLHDIIHVFGPSFIEPVKWEARDMLRFGDVNKYLLYTRKNRNTPQVLDSEDSIISSNFDPTVDTAILVHGWLGQPEYGLGPIVTKALLNKKNINVIYVDWSTISDWNYLTAVLGVPYVGIYAACFIRKLKRITGISLDSVHLMGHSLGAHVVGNTGRWLNGQVARVTGLDPAGPAWYFNPFRIDPSDGQYLEAIHTNAGCLGIMKNVGDVDFYPNGGSMQPGCQNISCHHGRAYELMAASIEYPRRLVGKRCSSMSEMERNECEGRSLELGNIDIEKNGDGIYRLETGDKYPF